MATLDTIRTITIRGRTEGLDQATAAVDKFAAAHGRAAEASEATAKVTETSARRQLSAAGAFERLSAQLDPVFRAQQQMARGQAILDRSLEQGVISASSYAASLERLRARYGTLGVANSNLVGQTGNLAAQFNDIAVQLSAGTSPFLIAMQQGTQISQVLGDRGAKGAVQALGAAFMSVVSPVSLATIGIIALGGALVQYIAHGGQEVQSLDDKLKKHADIIAGIRDAYGEAAKGLEDFATQSRTVLEAQLRASMSRLKTDLESQAKGLVQSLTNVLPTGVDIAGGGAFLPGASLAAPIAEAVPLYGQFADAIARLQQEAARGEPNIRAFRDAVAAVMNAAAGDAALLKLGEQLLASSNDAARLQDALGGAARAVDVMGAAAAGNTASVREFGAALRELANIGLSTEPIDQAARAYQRALENATSPGARASADTAFLEARQRIADREAEKAAEAAKRRAEADARRAARAGAGDEDAFERSIVTAQGRTRQIEEETRLLGTYGGALEAARLRIELETAAKKRGMEVTAGMREQIEAEVEARRAAVEQLEAMRKVEELKQSMADLGKDVLSGFINDLRQGKSAADALANALNRVVDRLLDMALDGLFDSKGGGLLGMLFKGFGGGGSSFQGFNLSDVTLSPGLQFHGGGMVGLGGQMRYVHPAYFETAPRLHDGTLRPDERAAILQTGEVVLSRQDVAAARSGGPGGVTINNQVINQSGARVETQARPNGAGGVDILTVVSDRVKADMVREVGRNGSVARTMGAPGNWRG